MALKLKRFRFTSEETLKVIKEFFNFICEDISTTEDEMWKKLHLVLCHDHARFQACRITLLKSHLLDQVTKFKKYDSGAATESEKERLRANWGVEMRRLMEVWVNYEELVKLELRLRKINRNSQSVKTKPDENREIVKQIQDVSLVNVKQEKELLLDIMDDVYYDGENKTLSQEHGSNSISTSYMCENSSGPSTANASSANTSCNSTPNIFMDGSSPNHGDGVLRKCTQKAEKRKGQADNDIVLYLAEKSIRETELQREIHRDNLKLQLKQLELDKDKLKFEQEKWEAEAEVRNQQSQLHKATNSLLVAVLNSGILKPST